MSDETKDINIAPTAGIMSRGEVKPPAHPTPEDIDTSVIGGEIGGAADVQAAGVEHLAESHGTTVEELEEVLEKSPETAREE